MGNERNLKQIRGQLRQIAKELLPELLKQEIAQASYKNLKETITSQLTGIQTEVKKRLDLIDDRSKTIQNMMLREAVARANATPTQDAPVPPSVAAQGDTVGANSLSVEGTNE